MDMALAGTLSPVDNKLVYIVSSTRKSLLKHLLAYFEKHTNYVVEVVELNSKDAVNKYKIEIEKNMVAYFVFSNGTDKLDRAIKKAILDINPGQKLLFSENAWLNWQNFLYLDPSGIGNESELFTLTAEELANKTYDKPIYRFCAEDSIKKLSEGLELRPDGDYILVPLQVDGDSKMIIGSPHFDTVAAFANHIVDITPPDVKILFRNHPDNKKSIELPEADNVVDITGIKHAKKYLIENSLFVAGINTTFLIESMFLKHKTVTFGLDIFSNKNIIIEGMGKSFKSILTDKIDWRLRDKFIRHITSRQIPKTTMNESFPAGRAEV